MTPMKTGQDEAKDLRNHRDMQQLCVTPILFFQSIPFYKTVVSFPNKNWLSTNINFLPLFSQPSIVVNYPSSAAGWTDIAKLKINEKKTEHDAGKAGYLLIIELSSDSNPFFIP